VALGLASGFLEPLESTSLFLIQKAIQDMLRLLPTPEARGVDERLVREFNRLSDGLYERIRDFLILHYTANRRFGEPLWDHVRDYELPPSLRHKLRLFDSRGHVPYFKDGFFSRDSWLAVLFGQGLMPGAYDRPGRLHAGRVARRTPAGTARARRGTREWHAFARRGGRAPLSRVLDPTAGGLVSGTVSNW
jgi:hypothetical protein